MKTKLIAEIGCNHKGDFKIALQMIKILKEFCNVDIVKFQKRDNKKLLGNQYSLPHPNPENSYGKTYGEHRDFLEFSLDQHKEIKMECERLGLQYSCSVWDENSALEIISIKPKFIKIPSAQNTNKKLLQTVIDNYDGDVHISLGMTTINETKEIYNQFLNAKKNNNLVLYVCTSDYPTKSEDIHLLEINRLKKEFNNIAGYGFSGHHNGIAIDIAAITCGVNFIERHFTLDRTWKGTDHAASLEPDGMRRLKRDIIEVTKALTSKKDPNLIIEAEKYQFEKLKYKK